MNLLESIKYFLTVFFNYYFFSNCYKEISEAIGHFCSIP